MKKRKNKNLNRLLSTSIASSIILGTTSQNIITVNALEMPFENNIDMDVNTSNKNESINEFLEFKYSTTTSSAIEIEEVIENNDEINLPQGFSSNKIGNTEENAFAQYNDESKSFEVKGTGTYIGKDLNVNDNYHFVNYKVEGDATIIARLVDFDMSGAEYGQAGIFIRDDNTYDNSDYFGVYVEPSKDQYRYAYRGNSNSGAAAINGLNKESKNKYIKIVKTNNNIRYYISDDLNFDGDNVLSNSQNITMSDNTWYVGFVVSNGTNNTNSAVATFDNVTIKDETGVVYSSNPIEEDVNDKNEDTKDKEVLKITNEPNSTVNGKNVEFSGNVVEEGKVKVLLNGKMVNDEVSLNSNDTFDYKLSLKSGRNSIDIYHTSKDNIITIKKYSVLCLADESYDIIVDSNYSGVSGSDENGIKTFKTVKEAVSSISTKNSERKVIFIKNGVYKEKLTIESPYISLVGEDKNNTILTYDDANGTIDPITGLKIGTSKSASVTVKSKAFGFTAENLTIENSFVEKGNENEQAVALSNEADQSSLINCRLVANQDTLLANASSSKPARQYYYKCTIEGDVDFIFGRAQAVLDDCDIISLDRKSTTNNGYITAANTWDKDSYGYLIVNSRLLGEKGIAKNSVSLGRPWRPSSATEKITPAVTYINCYMDSHITTKGWDDMGYDSLAKDSRFNEFGSYGPGAIESETREQLTKEEADKYNINSIFAMNSAATNNGFTTDWNPHNLDENSNNIGINALYKVVEINEPDTDKSENDDLDDNNSSTNPPQDGDVNDDNSSSNQPENGDLDDDNSGTSTPENGETGSGETDSDNEDSDKTETDDSDNSNDNTIVIKPGVENPDNNIILTSKNWVKNSDKTLSLVYNGQKLTGWQKVGKYWYYLNDSGIMQTSWVEYDGNSYYLKSNGQMATGWLKLNNKKYYLNEDGTMAKGWKVEKNKEYYLTEDGSAAVGMVCIDNNRYYFKSDGTKSSGWVKLNGNRYYFNADGTMKTGWHTEKNKKYYLQEDGIASVGFTEINGNTYYFKSDGTMVTGWVKDGNDKYYFENEGNMVTGWLTYKKKTYYLKNDGSMTIGWSKIDNKWYYFKTDGAMAVNTTIDGYKLNSDGTLSENMSKITVL